jgi:site-specific recombinase XerD
MAINWIKVEGVKGISYREHTTRIFKKHKDRYFAAFYKLDGKTKCEAFGWESDGWTPEKAVAILQELKQNQKTGQGARTLAEKREQAKKQKEEEEPKEDETITFSQLYEMYMPVQKIKKEAGSWKTEEGFYKNWLADTLGEKPIDQITVDDIQQILNNALKKGLKPASIRYIRATVRQILNFAKDRDLYEKENVATKVAIPSVDNRRTRFFTKEEVCKILAALKERSQQTHDIALFAMYTGCRPKEIFSLKWENINFATKIMTILKTKNGKMKHVPMTKPVEELLHRLMEENSTGLVFRSRKDTKIVAISKIFFDTIKKLGINDRVKDEHEKGVFYTLRHTYASWLMMEGADFYDVKELMGHSTTAMTERYSHLSPEHLKKTASLLDKYKIVSPPTRDTK